MIVSHNELVAAVNKAFLGMRRHCGEADVIANMVVNRLGSRRVTPA